MNYLFLFGSILISVVGQIFLKKGVSSLSFLINPSNILKMFTSPLIIIGFIFYGISAILWLFVLKNFPISTAYPFLSLTYVLILIYSFFGLSEPISLLKIAGTMCILFGVFLVSR